MNATSRRALVVAGLLLLTAAAVSLVVILLDPDGGPSELDPLHASAPETSAKDAELSAVPPRLRVAPTLRGRARVAKSPTQPDDSGVDPAAPVETNLTVRDESGMPAVGVAVTVEGAAWSGVTDESGALQLPGEVSWSKLSVSGPEFTTVHLERPTGQVLVVLEGTGVLVGQVRYVDGVAVAGARVFVVRPGKTTPVPDRPEWAAETGSDGAFRLTRLPPGDWEVRARLDAQGNRTAMEASHRCVMPGAGDVVLVLGRARDIRGRVTAADGALPPGQLTVIMRGVRPDGGNGAVWSGTVAADGTFVIPGVGSGTNVLWAWTLDRGSRLALTILRDVRPGTGNLHIVLDTGDAIEGSLLDDRGEPVKGGGWLYAYDKDVLVNSVTLAGDGTFRTHLLPQDGVYDITVISSSGWSGTVRGAAAGTSGVVVRGRRMPPLTGSVWLPDGSSAGAGIHVQVKALGIGADERQGAAVRVSTDADGRFSIPKLGDFPFVVTASGGSTYAPARVPGTVRPGADVQLRLQPPERLAGRVMLASSEPAVGAALWVLPEDRAFAGWPLKADESGHFSLPNLPVGAVRFVLDTLDGEVEVGRAVVPAENIVITLPAR